MTLLQNTQLMYFYSAYRDSSMTLPGVSSIYDCFTILACVDVRDSFVFVDILSTETHSLCIFTRVFHVLRCYRFVRVG